MNIQKHFSTIDTHVLGEAFRIITHSPIQFMDGSLEDKAEVLVRDFMDVKDFLLNEPRGHRGMNGCLVVAAQGYDFGVLFLQNDKALSYKVEGVLATLTSLLETGVLSANERSTYRVNTLEGELILKADLQGQEVVAITYEFESTALIKNSQAAYRTVSGRTYGLMALPESILSINLEHLESIQNEGARFIENAQEEVDGLILIEHLGSRKVKTVTYEKDGYIRRTPGLETSQLVSGYLDLKDGVLTNESIFGSQLVVQIKGGDSFQVTIRPFITGSQTFVFDPTDPLPQGFIIK